MKILETVSEKITTLWRVTLCLMVTNEKKQETSVPDCSACDVELHYIVHPSPRSVFWPKM
jgi:hypothetical protein